MHAHTHTYNHSRNEEKNEQFILDHEFNIKNIARAQHK